MSTRSLPSALEPYLRLPPEASLILLTSTLGCSVSWLATRYISSILGLSTEEPTSVLLVSWLRDLAFWKSEVRRGAGLDISKLQQNGKFAFIDSFSNPKCTLQDIEKSIREATTKLPQNKILLILDNPDILLATASTTAQELNNMVLSIRSLVHATIVTCSADQPFLAAQSTPIEAETAAFTITQGHASRLVMSVRELDTGAAKDISGVLRITRGGDYGEEGEEEGVKEAELLYLVQRDGNVKVFNRGADIS